MADPPSLVFVTGARRSGTTLLHQLVCRAIARHPFIPECQVLTRLAQDLAWGEANWERMTGGLFAGRAAYDAYCRQVIGAGIEAVRAGLGHGGMLALKNPELCLVLERMLDWAGGEPRVILSVRDPRDQVASELDLAERRGRSGDAGALARTFLDYYERPVAMLDDHPARIIAVRYEDLTAQPEQAVDAVGAFLGAEPQTSGLTGQWDFGRASEGEMRRRPSWSELYGRPVSVERVGRFRERLTPEQARTVEAVCGGFMQRFGYAPG